MDINRPPDEQPNLTDALSSRLAYSDGQPTHASSIALRSERPRLRPLPIPLSKPIVTQMLVGINVLVWVAVTLYTTARYGGNLINVAIGSDPALDNALLDVGALANACLAAPGHALQAEFGCIGGNQWWRLFTAMFLHGGLVHVGFNSWALYVLGREAEQLYGRLRFLVIYLLSGLAGSVLSMSISPQLGHISVGASGAIFGILGLLLAYYFRYRNQLGAAGRSQLYNILLVAGLNLFLSSQLKSIDNWAHTGGMIGGIILGLLLAPVYAVVNPMSGPPRLADKLSLPLQWAVVGGYIVALGLLFVVGWQRLGSLISQ